MIWAYLKALYATAEVDRICRAWNGAHRVGINLATISILDVTAPW